ncbi:MAG: ATP-dependent zinc metalloprotease FtsH [Bacteroidales bacterium]|nr:ATP-dependent zinc metalloprotease FtsH [Bacteroidales bacterium]MCF8327365.1 ATP-dependent zinc metalloprotease FtsH [Bacteroidales bacterium]
MAENNKENKVPENSGSEDPKKKNNNFYWIYGAIALLFILLQIFSMQGALKDIGWSELRDMIKDEDVKKIIVVNEEYAEITILEDKLQQKSRYEDLRDQGFMEGSSGPHYKYEFVTVESFMDDLKELQNDTDLSYWPHVKGEKRRNWGTEILGWLIPILFLVALWFFLMRMMSRGGGGGGSQMFNMGKSKAQIFDKKTSINVNFKDVAGLEEAKIEIMEIVDFLKEPEKYTSLGGKIPKGALLVGPPGTGKTLLAKAVAGEAQVPFFSMSGSDFVEMFVGVGASRVRDLFKQAKEKAPCIIFIDEIDAIGRARGKNPMAGSNDEKENTLNQLLTEMDGFSSNAGVIILAATNRADMLDKALLRAGRFDRQIHVELPDLKERKQIFGVHTQELKLGENVNLELLAKQTPGFSGADIANACNEAALIGARNKHTKVTRQDFIDAIDRIIGGLEKRNKIISKQEKEVIAFHEAGHASVSWMLRYAQPLVKVTIIPRGKALGAAWYLPEERQITTYDQMFDEITAALGGRAAEEIIFNKVSTGALNDLEKVTKQAYAIVTYFGLNERIGNISFYDSSGRSEYSFTKPYSEKTAQVIDEEISKVIEDAYENAKKILRDHKEQLLELAKTLLEKEVIFRDDVQRIFGEREWSDKEEDEDILSAISKANIQIDEDEDVEEKKEETETSKEKDTDDSSGHSETSEKQDNEVKKPSSDQETKDKSDSEEDKDEKSDKDKKE